MDGKVVRERKADEVYVIGHSPERFAIDLILQQVMLKEHHCIQ